eukprot:48731_1
MSTETKLQTTLNIGSQNEFDDNKHIEQETFETTISITKQKKWYQKFVNFFLNGIKPFQRISAFIDIYSDFVLLWKTSKDLNLIGITCIMLISILSPYLVCYASGIRLHLNRGTLQSAVNTSCYKLLLLLYILPTGVLWYIFLDIYIDLTGILILAPYYLIKLCISKSQDSLDGDLENMKRKIANWIGLTFMNLEGYSRMRSISQLMLESLPQICIQTMMAANVFILTDTTITTQDIVISIGSAVFNMISQFTIMKMESAVVRETFISYSLSCMVGRIGWIPFIHEINTAKNSQINYSKIKRKFCGVIPKTINYKF